MIPGSGVTHILDLVVVLVRPETVDIVVGSLVAEHRPSRRTTLRFSVVVVLYTQPAEHWVEVIGNVACGVDVRGACSAGFINQDPVVQGDLAAPEGVDGGLDPNGHHRKVTVNPGALDGNGAFEMLRTFESDHPILGHQPDAVVLVDAGHHRCHLTAEHRCQRGRTVDYRGDLEPQLPWRAPHPGPAEPPPRAYGSPPRIRPPP